MSYRPRVLRLADSAVLLSNPPRESLAYEELSSRSKNGGGLTRVSREPTGCEMVEGDVEEHRPLVRAVLRNGLFVL